MSDEELNVKVGRLALERSVLIRERDAINEKIADKTAQITELCGGEA
jgi:hypothetical protein